MDNMTVTFDSKSGSVDFIVCVQRSDRLLDLIRASSIYIRCMGYAAVEEPATVV